MYLRVYIYIHVYLVYIYIYTYMYVCIYVRVCVCTLILCRSTIQLLHLSEPASAAACENSAMASGPPPAAELQQPAWLARKSEMLLQGAGVPNLRPIAQSRSDLHILESKGGIIHTKYASDNPHVSLRWTLIGAGGLWLRMAL